MCASGFDYRRRFGILLSRIEEAFVSVGNLERVPMSLQQPTFTFTFDDAPSSAYDIGAHVLEDAGIRGTFFLCGKYIAEKSPSFVSRAQALNLIERGHTMGSHTYNHVDAQKMSSNAFRADAIAGAEAIASLLGSQQAACFSYPFGNINRKVKAFSSEYFFTCRGSFPGINATYVDPSMIRANRLYSSRFCHRQIERLVQKTVEQNAWTVFYTHDVSTAPSRHGITPNELRTTIDLCKSMGGTVRVFHEPVARLL